MAASMIAQLPTPPDDPIATDPPSDRLDRAIEPETGGRDPQRTDVDESVSY